MILVRYLRYLFGSLCKDNLFKPLQLFLSAFIFLTISACQFDVKITKKHRPDQSSEVLPNPNSGISSKAEKTEFVSASNQYEITNVRRYKVHSSVGAYQGDLVSKSPHGYVLYSSIQGELLSQSIDGKKQ